MIIRKCDMCGKVMDPGLIAWTLIEEDALNMPTNPRLVTRRHFDNALCLALFAAGRCGKEVCDGNQEGQDDQGARAQGDQESGA